MIERRISSNDDMKRTIWFIPRTIQAISWFIKAQCSKRSKRLYCKDIDEKCQPFLVLSQNTKVNIDPHLRFFPWWLGRNPWGIQIDTRRKHCVNQGTTMPSSSIWGKQRRGETLLLGRGSSVYVRTYLTSYPSSWQYHWSHCVVIVFS